MKKKVSEIEGGVSNISEIENIIVLNSLKCIAQKRVTKLSNVQSISI